MKIKIKHSSKKDDPVYIEKEDDDVKYIYRDDKRLRAISTKKAESKYGIPAGDLSKQLREGILEGEKLGGRWFVIEEELKGSKSKSALLYPLLHLGATSGANLAKLSVGIPGIAGYVLGDKLHKRVGSPGSTEWDNLRKTEKALIYEELANELERDIAFLVREHPELIDGLRNVSTV